MTAHGDGYAADKNVASMFPGTRGRCMDSSDASNVYITGTGRSYRIYSMAGQQIPQESAKTRRMPA
jgi:hypothetical protein